MFEDKAVYQVQFVDKSKQYVILIKFKQNKTNVCIFVRWIHHSMCDCSIKRIDFEKKGGRVLETMKIPLAKKRRRGIRGGRRTIVSRANNRLKHNL